MVMRRILVTVCLLLSVSFAAYPQSRGAPWLKGTWEGTGFQIDTDETWTMLLKVQGGRFLIEYPSLKCGGEWKLVSINSRRARFKERITRGRKECVDRGSVTIERLNGRQLAFRYSYQGTNEVSASAILNKKK
jgi:hypothetical protein